MSASIIYHPSKKSHTTSNNTMIVEASQNPRVNENQGDYDPWVDYTPSEALYPDKKNNKNEKILKKIVKSGIDKENIPHHHNLMVSPQESQTRKDSPERGKNVNKQSIDFDFQGDFDEFPEKKLEDSSPNIFFEISPQTMIVNKESPLPRPKNFTQAAQCTLLARKNPKEKPKFDKDRNKSLEKRRYSTNCSRQGERQLQGQGLYLSPNDLSQCTFTPKTTTKSQEKRAFHEFLDSQVKFKEKQAKKIEDMKANMELSYQQNHTFRPEISNKSRKLVMSKSSNNLEKSQEKPTATPNPDLKQSKPNLSNSSKASQLAELKLRKIFTRVLTEQNFPEKLDFEQSFNFLTSIGVMSFGNQESNIRIMNEVWRTLAGDVSQGISTCNLYSFLTVVLRLTVKLSPAKSPQPSTKVLKESDGFVGKFTQEGVWEISSQEELRFLQKKFEILYLNKLSSDKQRHHSKTPEPTKRAQPSINPISKMLAMHHREKLLNEVLYLVHNNEGIEGGDFKMSEKKILNNVDLLVMQKKIQKLHHQYLQQEKIKQESAQCTFVPEINGKKQPQNRSRINSFSNVGPVKSKKDKDPLEIEFEKARKECTFKPDIIRKAKPTKKVVLPVKNEKKTIERLRNARVEKEFVETCRQRGMHSSHVTREKQQNRRDFDTSPQTITEEAMPLNSVEGQAAQEEKIPLLFVDVNLGQNKSERIVIYEGDRTEHLAREFCKTHSLDSSTESKLKGLLDEQISGVLTKISEEYPLNEEDNILDFYNN